MPRKPRGDSTLKTLLKLAGVFDYEGEIKMAVTAGGTLPVVEIFPVR